MMNAKALGLSGGIIWGVALCIITVLSSFTGYGSGFLNLIAGVYPYYSISLAGAFLGLIYGFVDAFVFFFLLGWLYNKFS